MWTHIGLVALLIAVYVIAMRLVSTAIRAVGLRQGINELRMSVVAKILNLGLTAVFILLLCVVLGVGYGQLAVFFSSVFAVVGVALFAQWSILSNITASLIIFFSFPYRVGDWIKVVDKDEEILGQIHEISTFHVIITRLSGDRVTYPNSLILQKAVICYHDEAEARRYSALLTADDNAEQKGKD
ncbi:mechanosensitive ion channel domain-containing protein [Marinomonas ostreistagni]|uniref:mechanosensitive ion channel domain-containing protein n=1 Tax=Marinomonas ostreistagni TaxID=359209 RepID=UPI0019527D68|nr:mechanosensitive ion channel domain-containing protein [Marinomonas ostreistagni]MBM6552379.1 mechanosensitive ion channel [Marinomonas ostreistagni]